MNWKPRLIALLLLAGLLAGCMPSPLPVPPGFVSQASTPFAPPPVLATALPMLFSPRAPDTPTVNDLTTLLDRLRSAGVTVEEVGPASGFPLRGQGRVLRLNGSEVRIFEYADEAAALADAALVSLDGMRIGDTAVNWPAEPHFYRKGRLLLTYSGTDLSIINPLDFVLGRQFAGVPVSGTPEPTATPLPATATSVAARLASPTPRRTPTPRADCTDRAQIVSDVTIPDNSTVYARESFTKTWRLRNTGTCTWSPEYALVHVSGNAMGGPEAVPLSAEVAPSHTVDVSVRLTAPSEPATYRSNWLLRDPAGRTFGLGSKRTGLIWVQIVVQAPAPAARVNFPEDGQSFSQNVTVPPGQSRAFVLRGQAGQRMSVTLSLPSYTLVVTGPDGQTLSAEAIADNGYQFRLPATGDYTLTLRGSGRSRITIDMGQAESLAPEATPTPTPRPTQTPEREPTPASPQRIVVPSDAQPLTFNVRLRGATQAYVVSAGEGERLQIWLGAPGTESRVAGPDGEWLAPASATADGTFAEYLLPATGDYTIVLRGQNNVMTIQRAAQ